MATETDLDLFARVVNGEIVEFPVYRLHIKNRSHPLEWYTPVVELEKPALPAFSYYKRSLVVKEAYVEASYIVVLMSLAELLPTFKKPSSFPGEDERMLISEVPPAAIQQVYILGGQYVTSKLDAFAKTRMYDDIKSLCDYRDSAFEKFRVEGQRGYYLRDKCWEAIIAYFNQVVTGVLPVPISISEVDEIIPPITWEDVVPETPEGSSNEPEVAPVIEETPADDTVVETETNTEESEAIGDPIDAGPSVDPDPIPTTEPVIEETTDPIPTTDPETPVEDPVVEETPTEPEVQTVP